MNYMSMYTHIPHIRHDQTQKKYFWKLKSGVRCCRIPKTRKSPLDPKMKMVLDCATLNDFTSTI